MGEPQGSPQPAREDGLPTFVTVPLAGGRDAAATRVTAVAAGDVDGDGNADLVASTATGDMKVFTGDGAGGFSRQALKLVDEASGCRGFSVALADLDSDGSDEVVAGFGGDSCPNSGSLRAWKILPQ